MLCNYLLIAYRNLLRHKVFSLINIVGLAIGMAACLLILQYVLYEWSYDGFHGKRDRGYRGRIQEDQYVNGQFQYKSAKTYPNVGPRLKAVFPEMEDFVRLFPKEGVVPNREADTVFQEDRILFADASFFNLFSFDLFSFELLKGNAAKALSEPKIKPLPDDGGIPDLFPPEPLVPDPELLRLSRQNQPGRLTSTPG